MPAPVTMLILSARVIFAISIFSRWLTGRDWFSQGHEDEPAVRAVSCPGAEPAEAEAADAEAAVASPAGSKTARKRPPPFLEGAWCVNPGYSS